MGGASTASSRSLPSPPPPAAPTAAICTVLGARSVLGYTRTVTSSGAGQSRYRCRSKASAVQVKGKRGAGQGRGKGGAGQAQEGAGLDRQGRGAGQARTGAVQAHCRVCGTGGCQERCRASAGQARGKRSAGQAQCRADQGVTGRSRPDPSRPQTQVPLGTPGAVCDACWAPRSHELKGVRWTWSGFLHNVSSTCNTSSSANVFSYRTKLRLMIQSIATGIECRRDCKNSPYKLCTGLSINLYPRKIGNTDPVRETRSWYNLIGEAVQILYGLLFESNLYQGLNPITIFGPV